MGLDHLIVNNQKDAVEKFQYQIRTIQDTTDLAISKLEGKKAVFEDGSHIRWYECSKDCLSFPETMEFPEEVRNNQSVTIFLKGE
jgi:hypothetical protein